MIVLTDFLSILFKFSVFFLAAGFLGAQLSVALWFLEYMRLAGHDCIGIAGGIVIFNIFLAFDLALLDYFAKKYNWSFGE